MKIMNSVPLVNIVMVTYNQEKYISQAIESVLKQKTTFSFQLIIGEDCSSDKTLHICKQYADSYPGKILLIKNSTNLGLVKNYERVFNACTAKYIAILEGDDYWIDEEKLQKQTEILESDKEIGMVHAACYMLIEDSGRLAKPSKKRIISNLKRQGNIYGILIRDNFIYSSTVLFVRNLLVENINYKFLVDNNVQTIDYALWLGISIHTKVAFIKDIVGVYRVRSTSISNNPSMKDQETFYHTVKLIGNYYLNIYPVDGFSIRDFENKINEWLFYKSLFYGDYQSAKLYAGMITKRSVKIKIMWSIVKGKYKDNIISVIVNILKSLKFYRR